MLTHRDTTFLRAHSVTNGAFEYAIVTPECKNYKSQFNYYFRVLWGNSGVTEDFERSAGNFLIIVNHECHAVVFKTKWGLVALIFKGTEFDSLVHAYKETVKDLRFPIDHSPYRLDYNDEISARHVFNEGKRFV